jgi:hypothetical protein
MATRRRDFFNALYDIVSDNGSTPFGKLAKQLATAAGWHDHFGAALFGAGTIVKAAVGGVQWAVSWLIAASAHFAGIPTPIAKILGTFISRRLCAGLAPTSTFGQRMRMFGALWAVATGEPDATAEMTDLITEQGVDDLKQYVADELNLDSTPTSTPRRKRRFDPIYDEATDTAETPPRTEPRAPEADGPETPRPQPAGPDLDGQSTAGPKAETSNPAESKLSAPVVVDPDVPAPASPGRRSSIHGPHARRVWQDPVLDTLLPDVLPLAEGCYPNPAPVPTWPSRLPNVFPETDARDPEQVVSTPTADGKPTVLDRGEPVPITVDSDFDFPVRGGMPSGWELDREVDQPGCLPETAIKLADPSGGLGFGGL